MSYSEAVVEHLLASVWDRSYAWGVQNPQAPNQDMPKAKVKDPKSATNFWCYLIDVRMAWENAPLTFEERRALFLYYALGWEQAGIGLHESVSKMAISKRINKGLRCMTDWLNAEYETEHDD